MTGSTTWTIALDVDGTLYDGNAVAPAALTALQEARARGHRVVIVTGRRFATLTDVVPDVLGLCAAVVAEEGGELVDMITGDADLLAPALDVAVVEALVRAGVDDLDIGRVSIGTARRHEAAVRTVQSLHAPQHHVVVNKGSVALLPVGCDKAQGLRAVLHHLHCDDAPVLAVGDAENDLPMFAAATQAAAVANADPAVVAAGITVMSRSFGDGVAEAIERFVTG